MLFQYWFKLWYVFIFKKRRVSDPNKSDKKQTKKMKIEIVKEKQEKSDGERKRERRGGGRYWYVEGEPDAGRGIDFFSSSSTTFRASWGVSALWNPRVRRVEGGIEEERHISYFISRTAWIFFRIFKARARITWGYQSDRCFCSTAFVSPTDRRVKNIGEIWLENRWKLLYSWYSVKAYCPAFHLT